MQPDVEWEEAKNKGKKHFVLIDSFLFSFSVFFAYIVFVLLKALYNGNLTFASLQNFIVSYRVIDWFAERIFYFLMVWMIMALFRLLLWTRLVENRD